MDEFNRWAEPLNENIARVVAEDLAALLGTPQVATVPLANFEPAYQVASNPAVRIGAGQIGAGGSVVGGSQDRRAKFRCPATRSQPSRCPATASTRSPPRTAARWRRSAPTSPPPSGRKRISIEK